MGVQDWDPEPGEDLGEDSDFPDDPLLDDEGGGGPDVDLDEEDDEGR